MSTVGPNGLDNLYAAGDVGSIAYSDGTTGLTNSYDRRGRLSTVQQGAMLTTRTYSELNLLLTERYTGGLLNGLGLTNRYDANHLLRTNFFSVMGNVFFDYATSLRMSAVRRGSEVNLYRPTIARAVPWKKTLAH